MKEKIIKIKINGYSATGIQLLNRGSFQLPSALTSLGYIHMNLSHKGMCFKKFPPVSQRAVTGPAYILILSQLQDKTW